MWDSELLKNWWNLTIECITYTVIQMNASTFFFPALGIELGTFHLPSRCQHHWAKSPVHLLRIYIFYSILTERANCVHGWYVTQWNSSSHISTLEIIGPYQWWWTHGTLATAGSLLPLKAVQGLPDDGCLYGLSAERTLGICSLLFTVALEKISVLV